MVFSWLFVHYLSNPEASLFSEGDLAVNLLLGDEGYMRSFSLSGLVI